MMQISLSTLKKTNKIKLWLNLRLVIARGGYTNVCIHLDLNQPLKYASAELF